MNQPRYEVHPLPDTGDHETLVLDGRFPEAVSKLVSANMKRMREIAMMDHPLAFMEEYRTLAAGVIDTVADWLRSPECDLPDDRKQRLLDDGLALTDGLGRLSRPPANDGMPL